MEVRGWVFHVAKLYRAEYRVPRPRVSTTISAGEYRMAVRPVSLYRVPCFIPKNLAH